jgi:hypothetical protein
MSTSPTSQVRWLDFSGAPPMLIPQSLAELWRGTTDPATGEYREFDKDNPVTDYDRACAAARPERSVLEFRGVPILILYTEYDSTVGTPAARFWRAVVGFRRRTRFGVRRGRTRFAGARSTPTTCS